MSTIALSRADLRRELEPSEVKRRKYIMCGVQTREVTQIECSRINLPLISSQTFKMNVRRARIDLSGPIDADYAESWLDECHVRALFTHG